MIDDQAPLIKPDLTSYSERTTIVNSPTKLRTNRHSSHSNTSRWPQPRH